jgi:hypothetical protein
MSEEVDLGRRRFLDAAAMMIAAAQFHVPLRWDEAAIGAVAE